MSNDSFGNSVLSFDVATVAIEGKRAYQEDSLISSFALGQDCGFAILSDGMGGHTSGHIASALVVSEVFSQLKVKDLLLKEGRLNIPRALEDATQAANAKVQAHIEAEDETSGMGATLLSIVISRDKLFWVSVGDSPLLFFRNGALRQLNQDHSMAPQIDMMVKAGAMSPEAGHDHPARNTLTSAITGNTIAKIDCPARPVRLLPDDILIVASDGLQYLSNSAIAKVLKGQQSARSVEIAVALRDALHQLDHHEQDNAAFIVIRLDHVEDTPDDSAVDLDDLPVLAMADEDTSSLDAIPATAAKAEPQAKPEPDESKAFYYRGQKYYKD